MQLTQRLLSYLPRVFNKDPQKLLALRVRYDGAMTWRVRDGVLTTEVSGGSGEPLSIDLTAHTIASLADHIAAQPGYAVAYENDAVSSVGARTLLDGDGDQDASNGDHLYIYTSLLWAYLDAMASELTQARQQIRQMLRQLVVRTADGAWLDEIGSYYNVTREVGEPDRLYGPRIIAEVLRPRNNNIAIEDAVRDSTGATTAKVTDAPAQTVNLEGGGTADSYGLFDVEYGFDLEGDEDINLFAARVRRVLDRFRAAGTHLRQMTFYGELSDSVDSDDWSDSVDSTAAADFEDTWPDVDYLYYHDGTHLRDGSITYQAEQDAITLSSAQSLGDDQMPYSSSDATYDGSYQYGGDPTGRIFFNSGLPADQPGEIVALELVYRRTHDGTHLRDGSISYNSEIPLIENL